jgi:uncharacterized protein YggE
MRRLIDALKRAGAKDVATQYVSVSPRYQDGQMEIVGYTASNSVSATIGVDRVGALIDAAAEAGANQVYGPSMSRADADELYREALAKAVADARTRAATLAAAAGSSVGRVLSMVEGGGQVALPTMAKAALDSSTPVEAGTQETSATVSVTFALS